MKPQALPSLKAVIVSALDQEWAELVNHYGLLTPTDRAELAAWLTGKTKGPLPKWVLSWFKPLAQTAFLETELRWANREQT